MDYLIKNNLINKIVYEGNRDTCINYMKNYNYYGLSYSLLTMIPKLTYTDICEAIWGCVPTDTIWAKETNIYKQYEKTNIQK